MLAKRARWSFNPTSHLCSEHFSPEDFDSQCSAIPGTSFVGPQSLKNDAFVFKYRLVSGTQQLILLTLFINQPVYSDQTDFIRDLTLNREPQN